MKTVGTDNANDSEGMSLIEDCTKNNDKGEVSEDLSDTALAKANGSSSANPLSSPRQEENEDDDSDSDDSMNKKPAAVEDENDDDSSSSGSEDSESDQDSVESDQETSTANSSKLQTQASLDSSKTKGQQLDEEGRPLSEYEIQRLERIKRNRELLAQLGLHGKGDGSGVLGKKKNAAQLRKSESSAKKNDTVVVERRQTISRKTKLNRKSYKEPSKSIRDMMREADQDTSTAAISPRKPPKPAKKPRSDRMSKEIYEAFQQISAKKKSILKQAQRNVRYAEKEVKYWSKRVNALDKPVSRIREDVRERRVLEGKTGREFVQIIDERMSEISETLETYENTLTAGQKQKEREYNLLVANEKLKLMDALDRFPKAMKQTSALLNSVLLERVPKDPPPPRRSKRSMPIEEEENSKPAASKKASRKKQKKSSEDEHDISNHTSTYDAKVESGSEDKAESNPDKLVKGRTKRVSRNVGGWVSPEFSQTIDRSWLENSHTEKVSLSAFVPQPGETVLYYVAGHKKYLELYPDVLAKKTRTKSRVPLWERAVQTKEKRENKRTASKVVEESNDEPPESWWSEKWQTGDYDAYPLLCRVERTHAEFPPDPWGKVVQKEGEGSDGAKLYFKKPKGPGSRRASEKPSMRLAVELRPLLPLIPTSSGDRHRLGLPPVFTVVTFPCLDLEPFLVPFVWAYARTHALRLNQKVEIAEGQDGSLVRVDAFSSIENQNTQELTRQDVCAVVNSYCQDGKPLYSRLDEEVANTRLPLRDARMVLDLWRQRVANDSSPKPIAESFESPTFFDLLGSSMPLWQGIKTMKDMFDRRKVAHSPWRLFSPAKKRVHSDPWSLHTYRPSIDKSLVSKLSCSLNDFLVNNAAASDLFLEPITEELAPSYYCAVPIGMCLAKIKKRLEIGSSNNCFYRTIEALHLDISSLLECCLLYNNPDSPVVAEAFSVVSSLRDSINRISQDHNRESREAMRVDEERRRFLRELTTSVGAESTVGVLTPGVLDIRKPTKGPICSDWLEETKQPLNSFQAGDKIRYSREYHKRFVEAHYGSLESFQCVLPKAGALAATGTDKTDWKEGTIRWSRAVFPKSLLRLSADDAYTFPASTTLQCLGVQFDEDKDTMIPLYWRPCYSSDGGSKEGRCSKCSLSYSTSFITLVDPTNTNPFSEERVAQLFQLFKSRCIENKSPSAIDSGLTKSAVQAGFVPPQSKRIDIPPLIETLTLPGSSQQKSTATQGAGVSSKKQGKHKSSRIKKSTLVTTLVNAGVLPAWVDGAMKEGDGFCEIPSSIKSVFPSPRLCFDLLCARLEEGYYRQKEAIENDLLESYISVTAILLFEGASRKKAPLSMKTIAKSLNAKTQLIDDPKPGNDEDRLWIDQIRQIRELYMVAFVTVSNPDQAQRLFGLSPPLPPKPPRAHVCDPDPIKAFAREKISRLLDVLGKDKCTNVFQFPSSDEALPVFALTVKSGGQILSFDEGTSSATKAPFTRDQGEESNVTLVLRNNRLATPIMHPVSSVEAATRKSYTKAPTILIGGDEYEGNEVLSRFLFQRPDRMRPCVRCRSYRRSMLVCRVLRKHSNSDYDWADDFGGGVQFLDRLLGVLKGEDTSSFIGVDAFVGSFDNVTPDPVCIDGSSQQELESGIDPRNYLKEAESVLEMSTKTLELAQLYSKAPNRLSKGDVAATFPIDREDGHFLFCVVCGLSGDLLCCDGCPNVVHVSCVGLKRLPDGDWFCDDCQQSKAAKQTNQGSIKVPETAKAFCRGPFGRAEFDESDLFSATQNIERLQSVRPTQKVKPKIKEPNLGPSGVFDAVAESDEVKDSDGAGHETSPITTRSPRREQFKGKDDSAKSRQNLRNPLIAKDEKSKRRKRSDDSNEDAKLGNERKRRRPRRFVTTPEKSNDIHENQLKKSPRQRAKTKFFRPADETEEEGLRRPAGTRRSSRSKAKNDNMRIATKNQMIHNGKDVEPIRRSSRKARKNVRD